MPSLTTKITRFAALALLAAFSAPAKEADFAEPENRTPPSGRVCQPERVENNSLVPFRDIAADMACQQFRIWTFPKQLRKRNVLLPSLAVAGITAGLVLSDHSVANSFRGTNTFSQFNDVFRSNYTKNAILATPFAFYGLSLIRRDRYAQQTAIEAGEALLQAELVTAALKAITQRPGPGGFAPTAYNHGTWFSGHSGAFPSSHSATAFAVASVFARRYSNHKWVPYVAYGSASLVAFSTLTLVGHYPSEVFLGSAIGFSIGNFAIPRSRHVESAGN
jgi:membrane-associated phospholipid phosphatase